MGVTIWLLADGRISIEIQGAPLKMEISFDRGYLVYRWLHSQEGEVLAYVIPADA